MKGESALQEERFKLIMFYIALVFATVILVLFIRDMVKSDRERTDFCDKNFTVVSNDAEGDGLIIYDNETKVMYYVPESKDGTMTMLVNADGSPKTYEDTSKELK